ncbi:alpha-amylase [Bacteroidetes/Chlorobi group bacterium Naka2016]|jgi:glycosidase|nr:MAG: alpha-amylase [Bacteroidetes/Chlorobi group bacterium Naka2016]
MKYEALEKLANEIEKSNLNVKNYYLPRIWLGKEYSTDLLNISPKDFFLKSIDNVLKNGKTDEHTIRKDFPFVYCTLLRYTTTFDHNNDGRISIEPIDSSVYETGTFLKSISLLPYLKKIGVDIIYLLPVFQIGKYGRKGILGSPYAYTHPYKLDPRLGEPFLQLDLETQFKAFVEACHILDIKVVLEFVFRTTSIDSDLALEHPDWFYWIREDDFINNRYQPPKFSENELNIILNKIERKDFADLIPPNKNYISLFTPIPKQVFKEGERIVGLLENGNKVTIPFAFADWPPNDVQPLWTDVTYFRYYNHPNFNYIAYNTIRMYDNELVKNGEKVQDLWNFLVGIIPHYIDTFGIDGAMIDMGHAIPEELLSEIITIARKHKEDFIFWEENFNVTEKSKKDGYNATLGNFFFDQNDPQKLFEVIKKLENHSFSLPFFFAPETHNTPRSAKLGMEFNKLVAVFDAFLPGVRFMLSGFEFFHEIPYNTGLCFKPEEIALYPPENLPLYSPIEFRWNSDNCISLIETISELISYFHFDKESFENYHIKLIETTNPYVVCYSRESNDVELYVFGNFSNTEAKFSFENLKKVLLNSEILLGEFCLTSEEQLILQPFGYLVLKKLCSS